MIVWQELAGKDSKITGNWFRLIHLKNTQVQISDFKAKFWVENAKLVLKWPILVQKVVNFSRKCLVENKMVIFVDELQKWVEQLESYDGKSTGSDPGASYRKLKKHNFCWNHDYIEKKPLKPMLKKYQGRNRFVEMMFFTKIGIIFHENDEKWWFLTKNDVFTRIFYEFSSLKWTFLPVLSKISNKNAKNIFQTMYFVVSGVPNTKNYHQ